MKITKMFVNFLRHCQIESFILAFLCALFFYWCHENRIEDYVHVTTRQSPRAAGFSRETPEKAPEFIQLKVDLNDADRSELTLLPGIGAALADRIATYREENGGFQSVDDLMNVQGIGPKTLERLRPNCQVSSAITSDVDD